MESAAVGRVVDWEAERTEAVYERRKASEDRAQRDFERIARELAGDDHTLRRVLEARLKDAYRRGEIDERDADHHWQFGWLQGQTF